MTDMKIHASEQQMEDQSSDPRGACMHWEKLQLRRKLELKRRVYVLTRAITILKLAAKFLSIALLKGLKAG